MNSFQNLIFQKIVLNINIFTFERFPILNSFQIWVIFRFERFSKSNHFWIWTFSQFKQFLKFKFFQIWKININKTENRKHKWKTEKGNRKVKRKRKKREKTKTKKAYLRQAHTRPGGVRWPVATGQSYTPTRSVPNRHRTPWWDIGPSPLNVFPSFPFFRLCFFFPFWLFFYFLFCFLSFSIYFYFFVQIRKF
jgi:hypothetical protein